MEEMGIERAEIQSHFWRGRRVPITGHTGFKGSWLSLWLQAMRAEVHGFALAPPTVPALFNEARVAEGITQTIADIRDYDAVKAALLRFKPEVVVHMAAQPLVRFGYTFPKETYETNVMGTVHLFDAVREASSVKVILNVTTDKCYVNREMLWGYREDEPMGGGDPYSSSKACSELITTAYRQAYFRDVGVSIASARAGNVIGGGDWAKDRLIPDILQSLQEKRRISIRNPNATRPWQHVLEPLSGYLILIERLFINGPRFDGAWNFGPNDTDIVTVKELTDLMCKLWGHDGGWHLESEPGPYEAALLKLDISKVKLRLGWNPRWDLKTALNNIVLWHKSWSAGADARNLCLDQINQYQFASKSP